MASHHSSARSSGRGSGRDSGRWATDSPDEGSISRLAPPAMPSSWPARPLLLRLACGGEGCGAPLRFNSTDSVFSIDNALFSGRGYARFRGLPHEPKAYFAGKKRHMSTVVQGRVKRPIPLSECATGFEFSAPLAHLPARSVVALILSFVKTIAPTANVDILGDTPSILNPLFQTIQRLHVAVPGSEVEDITQPFAEETALLGGQFTERVRGQGQVCTCARACAPPTDSMHAAHLSADLPTDLPTDGPPNLAFPACHNRLTSLAPPPYPRPQRVDWKERKRFFASRSNAANFTLEPGLVYTMEFYEDKLVPSSFEAAIIGMRFPLCRMLGAGTVHPQPLQTMAKVRDLSSPHSTSHNLSQDLTRSHKISQYLTRSHKISQDHLSQDLSSPHSPGLAVPRHVLCHLAQTSLALPYRCRA